MRSEMKELLARAVAELPEKQQQVLSLYYFEELTMKEVGAVLGIGESRVSQIHSLAVVRLRSRLDDLMTAAKPQARAAEAGG
jgi:RNA polymerase sigma factor for flagellar operon FliA